MLDYWLYIEFLEGGGDCARPRRCFANHAFLFLNQLSESSESLAGLGTTGIFLSRQVCRDLALTA